MHKTSIMRTIRSVIFATVHRLDDQGDKEQSRISRKARQQTQESRPQETGF